MNIRSTSHSHGTVLLLARCLHPEDTGLWPHQRLLHPTQQSPSSLNQAVPIASLVPPRSILIIAPMTSAPWHAFAEFLRQYYTTCRVVRQSAVAASSATRPMCRTCARPPRLSLSLSRLLSSPRRCSMLDSRRSSDLPRSGRLHLLRRTACERVRRSVAGCRLPADVLRDTRTVFLAPWLWCTVRSLRLFLFCRRACLWRFECLRSCQSNAAASR